MISLTRWMRVLLEILCASGCFWRIHFMGMLGIDLETGEFNDKKPES